jgi:HEPN domain-containing protein
MKAHEITYIVWQNRATRFYLAARALYDRELYAPSAYCAHQATELIMKATLIYWDRSFRPLDVGHNLKKMVRMIRNKVRGARQFTIPAYLSHEKRFLRVTRYPTNGQGVFVPGHMIPDLDQLVVDLVCLVPFQFNSELRGAATGKDRRALLLLRKGNAELRRLRRHLASS